MPLTLPQKKQNNGVCSSKSKRLSRLRHERGKESDDQLLNSPTTSVTFGHEIHSELFSFVDNTEQMSSTPLNHRALPASIPVSNTSVLDNMSISVERISKADLTSSLRSIPSFMTTPTRSGREEDNLRLDNWGIPQLVLEQYKKRGISNMYRWQSECLMLPGVLQNRNLVFSAPTSAGKTFVAELLALKCVLETKRKVIIILPFVSIAHEKANYLQSIFEPNGVRVGGFMGGHSPSGGFTAVDIAICTIEKANSLINRLLEEGMISQIGAVVVDELHMIGDSHRGYLLELLLTKLLYISNRLRSKNVECQSEEESMGIQIVGMSATLPNLDTLSEWLEGGLYTTDFRPVPLQEMIKVGPTLFDTKFRKIRDLSNSDSASDEEDIVKLCEETYTNGHSVLIFCPSKQWCESLARAIASAPFLQHVSSTGGDHGQNLESSPRSEGLSGVVEQLRRTQVGLDGILGKTVPHAVGFHHAGLTFDEREIIEGAFRQGLIRILVATSTLSSGVNLPARLVIVRTPFFQRNLLDVLVYKQMVGRAGRKGVDERGESVLICKPTEKKKVSSLFLSKPAPVSSCLDVERRKERGKSSDVVPIRRAILEVIVSGIATTVNEVTMYFKCTLLFAEMKKKSELPETEMLSEKVVRATIDYLQANEFIGVRSPPGIDGNNETPDDIRRMKYHATQLGAATVASSLSPEEALVVFAELRKARHNFVLESELHIIYLVTPVYVQDQWPQIDWYCFLCLLERLPASARHVATILGVHESYLAGAIQGRVPERTAEQRERLRIHRRFFTALALHDLVHEVPIIHVANKYGVTKGLLQTLQGAAGTFSGMVTVFCARLGWKNLELLLSQFQSRLSFGVERELCDLVKVSLVNGFRARALYNAGFHSLSSLATANPVTIETCLRNAVPFQSSKPSTGGGGARRGGRGLDDDGRRNSTWCARLRRGMTEYEAAREIVTNAQRILSDQMNIPLNAWKINRTKLPLTDCIESERAKEEIPEDLPESKRRKEPRQAEDIIPMEFAVSSSSGTEPTSTAFKTPRKPRQSNPGQKSDARKLAKFTSTPIISLRRMTKTPQKPSRLTINTPVAAMDPPPSASPQICDSISYSPLFSPDSSRVIIDSPSSKPPLTLVEISPHISPPHLIRASLSPTQKGSPPLTIPNSLPCSMDMSSSFSRSTLAMIDAVCAAVPFELSEHGQQQTDELKIAESPVVVETRPDTAAAAGNTESKPRDSEMVAESPTIDIPVSQPHLKDLSLAVHSQTLSQSGACIIDVTSDPLLFRTFMTECLEQRRISFSFAVASVSRGETIGVKIIDLDANVEGIPIPYQNEQVIGLSICWGGLDAYYISLCNATPTASTKDRVSTDTCSKALSSIFLSQTCHEVVSYSISSQLKILASVFGIIPSGKCLDPLVADWMLNPDGKEKTLHKMILHYLPDQPVLTDEAELDEDIPLSNLATHGGQSHLRAAAQTILSSLLMSKLRPLLEEEGLYKPFLELEMPSLVTLTTTELNGIGFSKEKCEALKQILQLRLSQIEKEAYTHAGRSFSLTSPEDISYVLFHELQLPPPTDAKQQKTLGPNRRGKRRLQHFSTAKDVLEKLKSLHPLPGLILEWRRVSSTVTKTVFPLFKEAVYHASLESLRVHSTYHYHTATGRVATSDPNLQMVPKEYDIGTSSSIAALLQSGEHTTNVCSLLSESQCYRDSGENSKHAHIKESDAVVRSSINMRSVFVPFPGGVFLAADYSQLELRILAHMSGDAKLKRVLNGEGDVFKTIAAEWLGIPVDQVSAVNRQNAKQICYGIVYGIGAKALAEQLNVVEEEAGKFMETFKSKYPTMKRFIATTVKTCREKGYIVTLSGRKRYLSAIHSSNVHARSQAERQAVNSTIQGSAADLVKTAMINIDYALRKKYNSALPFLTLTRPPPEEAPIQPPIKMAYLVLQLHDELLYEVNEVELPNVAWVVKREMETSLNLSVRFPVKMKVGSSWGNLSEYSPSSSP